MFPEVPLIGVQNTIRDDRPSAVLWIISPRLYSNQVKRPMLYTFDGRFVNAAEEAVARMSEQHDKKKIEILTTTPAWLNNAVQFSGMISHNLDMSRMGMMWTFVLIVNNDKTNSGGIVRYMSDCQHLYSGVFLDEPINPVLHMGRQTINPNAQAIITHKTLINKHSALGSFGHERRVSVQSDLDVIHPRMIATLDMKGSGLSMIRPEDLYPNTTDGLDPIIMHSPESLLHNQSDPIRMTSNLAVPRYNLTTILNGVAAARSSMSAADMTGRMTRLNVGSYREQIEANIQDKVTLHDTTGLQTNTPITLGTIMNIYSPKYDIVIQDQTPRYSPMEQYVTSAQTIFSTMLTSTVPPLLADFALAEISFRYDSYNDTFEMNEGIQPAPLSPMHDNEIIARVRGFRHRMLTEILPIPKITRGDYVLYMTCTCFGVTTININFLDDNIHSPELFEVPTIMGGFNSSMIGDDVTFANNAREVSMLVGSLVGTDSDQPNFGLYEERRIDRALLSYDSDQIDQSTPQANIQPTQYRC